MEEKEESPSTISVCQKKIEDMLIEKGSEDKLYQKC